MCRKLGQISATPNKDANNRFNSAKISMDLTANLTEPNSYIPAVLVLYLISF